jgi:hypothetical protein
MSEIPAKQLLIDFLTQLPEDLTLEEMLDKLLFEENLLLARKDIREGRIYTQDQAKEIMQKWLQ